LASGQRYAVNVRGTFSVIGMDWRHSIDEQRNIFSLLHAIQLD
jgi:hypothetical protein